MTRIYPISYDVGAITKRTLEHEQKEGTMSTITKKEEAAKYITIGKNAIVAADICKIAQKDGQENGYTVGLVCGKLNGEGDKIGSRYFVPLAELLRKELGAVALSTFNEYTRVFRESRKCAEAVKDFTGRYNISLGKRAEDALATPSEDDSTPAVKRTDAERVCDFVGKLMTRKSHALKPVEVADLFTTALAACGGKSAGELADALAKATEVFVGMERLAAEAEEEAKAK